MRILATLCCLLLYVEAWAQRNLTGRVIDHSTGAGLPGVMVVLPGTTRGVITTDDGTYTLPLLPTDSLWLHVQFSSIGYISVTRQLHRPDSVLHAGLNVEQLNGSGSVICTLSMPARAELRLWSGLRYAPIGMLASVYARRYRYLPFDVTLGYQTNLRRNRQWLAELGWPRSYPLWRQQLRVALRHNRIQLGEPAFRFTSYQLRATVQSGSHWLPTVYVGGGYARQTQADRHQNGIGYELGLSRYFSRPDIWVQALAARWSGYWQWQGTIRHYFGRVGTGLMVDKIGPYAELSVNVSLALY